LVTVANDVSSYCTRADLPREERECPTVGIFEIENWCRTSSGLQITNISIEVGSGTFRRLEDLNGA